jgi:hypothetical protein
MPRAPIRIVIVAALCALGLVALVARETMARDEGTEIALAMEAVDPRALLSGHYVIVALREQMAMGEACPGQFTATLEEQVVTLAPAGESIGGVALYSSRASGADFITVRGYGTCMPETPAGDGFEGLPGSVALDIGVDRFYINQNDAERIDRMLRAQTGGDAQRVYAIVSVGRDGRARLKGLMVDGELIELGWM